MTERILRLKGHLADRRGRGANAGTGHTMPTTWFLDAYVANAENPPILREARALRALWSNTPVCIGADELIVGQFRHREVASFNYASATVFDTVAAQDYEAALADSEARRRFREACRILQERRYVPRTPALFTDHEWASVESTAASAVFFGGHMVMDYPRLLAEGWEGLRARVAQAAQAAADGVGAADPAGADAPAFHQAMDTVIDGVQHFIRRYADEAAAAARTAGGPAERRRLTRIAERCAAVIAAPPTGFAEALQLVWFVHLLTDCDSFGRFDQYLWPLLRHDLAAGSLSRDDARELLGAFWVKIEEAGTIQNMTLGGTDRTGGPAYNELTQLCLEVTADVGYASPNLCLRITQDMPDPLWALVHDTLATGQGLPALYNDDAIRRSLEEAGYPADDARDFCLAGCSQIILPGRSHLVNDTGMMNAAKILEITFHNGVDPATGRRLGPATGELTGFDSFESLVRAYESQLAHFCDLEKRINDKDVAFRGEREGYALRSLLTRGCLESGLGIYEGGAEYNGLQVEVIGLTNAADSLEAVRTAVFDEAFVSLPELVTALEADFVGYERLRQFLLRRPGKFGNGHEQVDRLRGRITAFTFDALRRLPGPLGGRYIPGEVIFIAHEPNGRAVGATPDGRRAGTVLADSAGPMQGRDTHGPTAMLRSVAALPVGSPYTCIVTNLRFPPELFRESREPVKALLRGFFREGGIQVQVSVADAGALSDAMAHPECHEGLIVRVGGYSAYFVGLSRELQREILERTSHAV